MWSPAWSLVTVSFFVHAVDGSPRNEHRASSTSSVIEIAGGRSFTVPPGYTPTAAVPLPKYMVDNQHNYFHAAPDNSYWLANMGHGSFPYAPSGYPVWRNVRDYGARGDGVTDDTQAIMRAVEDGGRCGLLCGSTSVLGGVVFFPAGTYMVSSPIIQYYFTQFIGDPTNKPTIKGLPTFQGIALIDTDVYIPGGNGSQWYVNQNQFFRQVRNFVIDLTAMPNENTSGEQTYVPTGIHWQVAQSTSLQNIDFVMPLGGGTTAVGIFAENGSGGFMSDLTFFGGNIAMRVGSQQFTARAITITLPATAVSMIWDWGWTWQDITVDAAFVAFDCTNFGGDGAQGTGSLTVVDSHFISVPFAIPVARDIDKRPAITLDNLRIEGNTPSVVLVSGGETILEGVTGGGSATIRSRVRLQRHGPHRPAPGQAGGAAGRGGGGGSGKFFTRSKPQYETLAAGSFVSVADFGAASPGSAAMWDSHVRIGGTVGSELQFADCPAGATADANCFAASLMMHITSGASGYFENCWVWTADHDLDIPSQDRINVLVGRGLLVEDIDGPIWLWGGAVEHAALCQYNFYRASNVFAGHIQTELPYYQPTPAATDVFPLGVYASDPDFADCNPMDESCLYSWAVMINNSSDVLIYGAGLYSWFDSYTQECLVPEDCQTRLMQTSNSRRVWMFSQYTKGATEAVSPLGGISPALQRDNRNGFLTAISAWLALSSSDAAQRGGYASVSDHPTPDKVLPVPDLASACGNVQAGQTMTLSAACASAIRAALPTSGANNQPPGPSNCQETCNLYRRVTGTCCGAGGSAGFGIEIPPGQELPAPLPIPAGFRPGLSATLVRRRRRQRRRQRRRHLAAALLDPHPASPRCTTLPLPPPPPLLFPPPVDVPDDDPAGWLFVSSELDVDGWGNESPPPTSTNPPTTTPPAPPPLGITLFWVNQIANGQSATSYTMQLRTTPCDRVPNTLFVQQIRDVPGGNNPPVPVGSFGFRLPSGTCSWENGDPAGPGNVICTEGAGTAVRYSCARAPSGEQRTCGVTGVLATRYVALVEGWGWFRELIVFL
ncbi:pectate lyase superfamily protein-domain-containing protein [Chaetomium strumarium]|uniref:Pectate lyase superfamily protein-domain-containing protein n=1 Tax=Chaetomium strumarium TaxID=1170767 RepID=A0AAJ0GW56_9PEZI|nr:pectate lyase superfamily protein-domain-containing protein [Chaetomium strumarium]